ncbi:TPA: hypothetical protein LVM22_001089 [Klebsiella oxytoca]|nr:hypothetical protein [Klebsiella oxytoca]
MRRFVRYFFIMFVALAGAVSISAYLTEREIMNYSDTVRQVASHHRSSIVDHDELQTLPLPVQKYLAFALPDTQADTDQLLRADILPLYELDEETFREATAQLEAPANSYITQIQFRHSERYWWRFMDWLERALRDVSDRCCRQLTGFVKRCSFDERLIRRWKSDYGEIRVYMEQQPVDEIDIMEFDTDYLTGYVDSVARGTFVPAIFHATVHYRNGSIIARFSGDADVNNPEHPGAGDYCSVVDDAIEWIRQEVDELRELAEHPAATVSEVLPERQLAA